MWARFLLGFLSEVCSRVIKKIISGGQTGVDRAALDIALELGIPCGGWCPKGRKAEDGVIPERYPLSETDSTGYTKRTKMNVLDADGTLVLYHYVLMGGSEFTIEFAQKKNKPALAIDMMAPQKSYSQILDWVKRNNIQILNVAGPREKGALNIHGRATFYLQELFQWY